MAILDKLGPSDSGSSDIRYGSCNFRCSYCMPKEVFGDDYVFLPKKELLSFEEIERFGRLFAHLGVKKLRLTAANHLCVGIFRSLVEKLIQSKASKISA